MFSTKKINVFKNIQIYSEHQKQSAIIMETSWVKTSVKVVVMF